MKAVLVSGSFDNLGLREVRFLEEASRLGAVTACLWSDDLVERLEGAPPRFPLAERRYVLKAVRFVNQVRVVENREQLPLQKGSARSWIWVEAAPDPAVQGFCAAQGIEYRLIPAENLCSPPPVPVQTPTPGHKKVLVTGCYDWLHSGHVRFFEEASAFGDLYVIVGNDANVRNLKGAGHPLFPEEVRRYMVSAIRYVHQAWITSGWGWMDAEPEIEVIRPDIYLVNEDGDKPEKRAFCAEHGLEYVVLKRLPKKGLHRRTSTDLRGF